MTKDIKEVLLGMALIAIGLGVVALLGVYLCMYGGLETTFWALRQKPISALMAAWGVTRVFLALPILVVGAILITLGLEYLCEIRRGEGDRCR